MPLLAPRLARTKRRLNRLGSLRHHPPRPLHLPDRYRSSVPPDPPPTVSLVTPSLNQARFLEATIESVLSQSYPAIEYVIQDGGSHDGSRRILEHYVSALHSWESAPDGGQAHALNRGFSHTTGEVMGWLNSDDVLLPGTLAYVAGYLRRNPSVDVVYGHRVLIDERGMEIGRHVIPRHDNDILTWADFIPQETLFWRRSAWEAAGSHFDQSFQCAMDWDLLVRFRDSGATMVRLPRFLGAFRVHGNQKTILLGSTVALDEMQRIRARLLGREVSQSEVLRNVRGYLLRHVALDQLHRRGLIRY